MVGLRGTILVFFTAFLLMAVDPAPPLSHPRAPTGNFSSPAPFSPLPPPGTISLSATAIPSGAATISEMRFYRDSVLIGVDATAPYGYSWINVPKGRYLIQARAIDNSGKIGYSQAATVFVNDSSKAVPGG